MVHLGPLKVLQWGFDRPRSFCIPYQTLGVKVKRTDALVKPNRLVFLEEKNDGLLRMTFNAYKSYYAAYLREKARRPDFHNDVTRLNVTVPPKEKERRHQERLDCAFTLGYDFGVSGKKNDTGFGNLSEDIRSVILKGMAEGMKAPRKTLNAYESKLLFMRARAFNKGRHVDLDMTAQDLAAITPEYCPILGTRLAIHGWEELHEDERHQWSVERMCNSLGYAKENIAVISTAANTARNNLDAEDILARAAGVVQDDQLTQIQWCRLFNHHFSSLRLENSILRKLPPPVTWRAPRYGELDSRLLAMAIADPHAPPQDRYEIPFDQLVDVYRQADKSEKEAVKLARSFKEECRLLELSCSSSVEVNLIAITAKDANIQMLDVISKKFFGPDYKSDLGQLSVGEHRLIAKATSAGYSFRP